MKKIYIVFILILAAGVMSCDDYLNIPPKNVITVRSAKDIKMMVGSYLREVEQNELMGYSIFAPVTKGGNKLCVEFADNLDFSGMMFFILEYFEEAQHRWRYPTTEYDIWNSMYDKIGDFNLYLYEIGKLGDNSEEMKAVESEVRMHRALFYLRLTQFFCPYRAGQYVKDPERYGLPILKSVKDLKDNYYPNRLSQKETFQFIVDDLKQIEKLNAEPVEFNLIYNKRALYGLLAEVYMWKAESPAKEEGDWNQAREYAKKSMQGGNAAKTVNDIKALFNPKSTSATSALRLCLPNGGYYLYKEFFKSDWDNIVVYDKVYNLYDENDIRRDFYINKGTKKIEKYDLADEAKKTVQPLWRMAEMQLITAESYVRTGDNANAKKELNAFKKTRIPGFTSYDKADILDEIIRERQKEFLCENLYRWFDMKRNGITYSRTTSKGVKHTLKPGDYRYSFIIPSSGELEENPNNFQNPGWDENPDEKK